MIISRKKSTYTKDQMRTLIYDWITTHNRLPHVADLGTEPHQTGVSYTMLKYCWSSLNDLWREAVRDGVATNRMLTESLARRGKRRGHRPSREVISYKNILFEGGSGAKAHQQDSNPH